MRLYRKENNKKKTMHPPHQKFFSCLLWEMLRDEERVVTIYAMIVMICFRVGKPKTVLLFPERPR